LRNKVSSVISIIIIIFGVIFIIFIGKPLPISFSKIDKIEFYDYAANFNEDNPNNLEEHKLLALTDRDDIAEVNKILKKARSMRDHSPACPFGIRVVLFRENKKIILKLGTDDCGKLIYKNKYYILPREDFKALQKILEQHGIDIHDFI